MMLCRDWFIIIPSSLFLMCSVNLVGVGEPFELRLVELVQELLVNWSQLHWLVCESCVKITHIHRVFLK